MKRAVLTALLLAVWFSQPSTPVERPTEDQQIGALATQPSVTEAGDLDAQVVDVTSDATIDEQSSDRLVQDPPLRSARRMDFSSGSRQQKHRSNFFVLQAFNEAIGDGYKSTVQVICDGQQCALGTVVHADGWVVTKASELEKPDSIRCLLTDERNVPAKLVGTDHEMDVALLRVEATDLNSVKWDYGIPEQGRWLATTDVRSSVPSAIGVVSAGPTRVPNQRAVLGVILDDLAADPKVISSGALVTQVLSGSGAFEAGIRERDTITKVDGKSVNSREHFLSLLTNGKGGQFLNLQISRGDKVIEKRARLMDMSADMLDETEMEVNGPISARSTGFGRVFMHDTVILPSQCGGPILNLDGKAVGINIARAGRVSTYALPADTLNPIIQRLMQSAQVVAQKSATRTVLTDSSSGLSTAQ